MNGAEDKRPAPHTSTDCKAECAKSAECLAVKITSGCNWYHTVAMKGDGTANRECWTKPATIP